MNDTTMRHLIALIATIVVGLAFYAGYISGGFGWWWAGFSLLIVYGAVYKLVHK